MPSFEKRINVTGKKIVQETIDKLDLRTPDYRDDENKETPKWASLLAKEIGGKVIASGAQRTVIDRGDGKVLGLYKYRHENADKLKAKYYIFKILHTLFPESFPRMYATGESNSLPKKYDFLKPVLCKFFPEHFLLFDIKEKISTERPIETQLSTEVGVITKYFREPRLVVTDREGPALENNAIDAWRIMHEIGFNLNLDYDNPRNFIDGIYIDSEIYLDPIAGGALSAEDKQRLVNWMKEKKYSADAILKVDAAFERLIELKKRKKSEDMQGATKRPLGGWPWEVTKY